MNDGDFERMLLQSARGDTPTGDARDAWLRFSGALGSIGSRPPTGARPTGGGPTAARSPIGPGGARRLAMKWLLLGAIGGSAATTAVMMRAGKTSAAPTVVVPAPIAPANLAGATATPSRAIARDVDPAPMARPPSAALPSPPRKAGRGHARARQDIADPRPPDSTLAEEVSRIDAARTANSAGDYDEAVWLIGRYHRDFPDGALAPDADVVALEAVAAKRDRPEAARRAALFLSRYPDDPHAAKVKWLAAHLGSEQR
jgi:hypothetical protein